ncbi:MAG: tetratricopeptide repeat protein, partial [Caldilineaceae bacterium]|nr:tetratricopeptide repeat protein [Caldilineaceae bacterium]
SVQCGKQAVALAKELGQLDAECYDTGRLGRTYLIGGYYRRAIQWTVDALRLSRQLADRAGEQTVLLLQLGNSYSKLWQYENALDQMNQSLDLAREIHNSYAEGLVLRAIGNLYAQLKDHPKAISYFRHANEISAAIMDREAVAENVASLGRARVQMGDHEQGIVHYKEALRLNRKLEDRDLQARLMAYFAHVYFWEREWRQAFQYYRQSVEIRVEHNETAYADLMPIFLRQLRDLPLLWIGWVTRWQYRRHQRSTAGNPPNKT